MKKISDRSHLFLSRIEESERARESDVENIIAKSWEKEKDVPRTHFFGGTI